MKVDKQKLDGAYYTPESVVKTLVSWAVRNKGDRLLDPSCGDGRFLMHHGNSVGVEQDAEAAAAVHRRSPGSLIHQGDFFAWASLTKERFDCAAGNPPFIRYHHFTGDVRKTALDYCKRLGARFSALTSSWAPFLVAAAGVLKPGGRMAFVVPAEIGHAPYARPLLQFLLTHFDQLQLLAVKDRLFDGLSEDTWLLWADGYGGRTDSIKLTTRNRFRAMTTPPRDGTVITLGDLEEWNWRIRPFLIPQEALSIYGHLRSSSQTVRFSDVADVGIGYVSGANGFFHLRPSEAEAFGVPDRLLVPTVRSGKDLKNGTLTPRMVKEWIRADEPNFLLNLAGVRELPQSVRHYLDTEAARKAKAGYKCRNRKPWYVVPGVTVPDGFMSYMNHTTCFLTANEAGCTCTNSVHAVMTKGRLSVQDIQQLWTSSLTQLSCEIEGHPLGGGMLKIEPGEAKRILLPIGSRLISNRQTDKLKDALETLKSWRHCG